MKLIALIRKATHPKIVAAQTSATHALSHGSTFYVASGAESIHYHDTYTQSMESSNLVETTSRTVTGIADAD